LFAHARAVARAAPAFVVGVLVISDVAARPVGPLAFSCGGASLARPQTPVVATNSIRAKPRIALRRRATCRAIDEFRDARGARARAITRAAARALRIWIRSRGDIAASAIAAAAFFRDAARLTSSHADVPAAEPVDTIIRQTLRRRGARIPVVELALVFPVASPLWAFEVGIGIIGNRAANAVHTAALFRGAARHALVVALAVATKAVDTVPGGALSPRRARRRTRWRSGNRRLPVAIHQVPDDVFSKLVFAGGLAGSTSRRIFGRPNTPGTSDSVGNPGRTTDADHQQRHRYWEPPHSCKLVQIVLHCYLGRDVPA